MSSSASLLVARQAYLVDAVDVIQVRDFVSRLEWVLDDPSPGPVQPPGMLLLDFRDPGGLA